MHVEADNTPTAFPDVLNVFGIGKLNEFLQSNTNNAGLLVVGDTELPIAILQQDPPVGSL